ncbi:hypothetical protein FRC01_005656 [Tulasnella sp. 417]|nr:hypothetical protein FRC01_005656 [Tulasnella sp. 417]
MDISIEDLSDEVLCEIFRLVILQPRPKPYPQPTSLARLSQLSAVSTEWRVLIRETPQLWSFLHSDDPHRITQKALRRSKGVTLHITYIQRVSEIRHDWDGRWFYVSVPDPETHADVFLDLVRPHHSRWREAFFVHIEWDALKELQRNPAPRLERVVIDAEESQVTPLNLFGGMGPLLKHVVCIGAALRWDGAILSGLLSLNVSLENRFKISPNNLVQLLANSPQLVSLRICQDGRNDVRVPTGTPTLHLPCLKKLELRLPSLFVETLLKRVRAPLCEDFGLETKRGSTAMVQTTVPFLRSSIRENLAQRSGRLRMTFCLSASTFECWLAYDGDADIFYHFYGLSIEDVDDPIELFAWAADNLLISTLRKPLITLIFSDGYQFEGRLRRIFKKLFRTTKVIVRHAHTPELLWLSLGIEYDETESVGSTGWPLPRLKEMVVYGPNHDWRYLRAMVKSRWEVGGLETPFRLKLRYSNADDEFIEDIEDVIGEGQVSQRVSDSGSEPDSDVLEEW